MGSFGPLEQLEQRNANEKKSKNGNASKTRASERSGLGVEDDELHTPEGWHLAAPVAREAKATLRCVRCFRFEGGSLEGTALRILGAIRRMSAQKPRKGTSEFFSQAALQSQSLWEANAQPFTASWFALTNLNGSKHRDNRKREMRPSPALGQSHLSTDGSTWWTSAMFPNADVPRRTTKILFLGSQYL